MRVFHYISLNSVYTRGIHLLRLPPQPFLFCSSSEYAYFIINLSENLTSSITCITLCSILFRVFLVELTRVEEKSL